MSNETVLTPEQQEKMRPTMPVNVSTDSGKPKKDRELHVFRHVLPHVKHILKNGKVVNFKHHMYYTDVPSEIAELDNEIENENNPYIRRPAEADQRTVLEEDLDPQVKLRKQHRAELLKELQAAGLVPKDKIEEVANTEQTEEEKRDSHRAELMAELRKAGLLKEDTNRDMGNTDQSGKIKIGNTANMAAASAESNSPSSSGVNVGTIKIGPRS